MACGDDGLPTDALTVAWDAFTDAAAGDLDGREVTAAAAEVQPEPPGDGAGSSAV